MTSPLPYLGNQRWAAIAREERLFCAELFVAIRGNERAFVAWLNSHAGTSCLALDESETWEIAYEVCFYRDLLFASGLPVRPTDFSDKRTFDLCLFSPSQIVIIEAKAQSGFDSKQNAEFEADKRDVPRALEVTGYTGPMPRVSVIALAASRYFENVAKYGRERAIPNVFDGHFSWRDVHDGFAERELFMRAEAVYGR